MQGNNFSLVIESAAESTLTAQRLSHWARLHQIPIAFESDQSSTHAAPDFAIEPSKQILRVVRHAGAVLKPCTGRTASLLCCNLHVITQTVGCPLNCSYCILQDYQNRSQIIIQADPLEILLCLQKELQQWPRRLFRICTGQVADSLALEPEVGFAAEAVSFFANLPNAILELKTKTTEVDFLIDLPHQGRTIISWSLSPDSVRLTEEHGAARLADRLEAARRVTQAGYLTAFHLDPIVALNEDPTLYLNLIKQLFKAVPASRMAYISMGTVRFLPPMRRTILTRFPHSRVTLAELLPDVDGKLRLLAPQRIAIYRAIAEEIYRHAPEVFVYLCMEPRRIWEKALGTIFQEQVEVEFAIVESLHRRFGSSPCTPKMTEYWHRL